MPLEFSLRKSRPGFSLDMLATAEDEITVLFGPSGCGKSTLLRLLCGLERPDAGRISLHQRVLYQADRGECLPPQLRRMGYLPQHDSLFPHWNAVQNVMFGARGLTNQEKSVRARALLAQFGLNDAAHREPHQLSGGQKQRVALARTLVSEPDALLLDEPFAALDSPSRFLLGDVLREIQRERKIPIILVTHDLSDALTLGHSIWISLDGRLVQKGTPHFVARNPCHPDVAALLDRQRFVLLAN